MLSVKSKLIALLVCALLVVAGAAGAMSAITLRETVSRDAQKLMLLECKTGQEKLDNEFKSVEQSVFMVSTFVQSDLDGLDDAKLQAHLIRVRDIFNKMSSKTSGILTYYYRIDPEVSRTVKGFWYVLGPEGVREHEVTDISLYDTRDTSKLVWFTVPKNIGKAVWLPPYITENLGAEVISYNVPVYYQGQFVGVIGIEIDYSEMANIVGSIRLYDKGYAFINDEEGKLVYHPKMDIATLDEKPAVPNGILSNSKFVHYTYEGVEKEAVWFELSNGLRLNLAVPVEELDADWQRQSIRVAVTLAVLSLAMIILIKIAVAQILRPQ